MAIAKAFDENTFNVHDYAIGGKMITATYTASYLDAMAWKTDFETHVKEQLAKNLAKFMLDNKLIEFTKISNHYSEDILYNARCYLAPDAQVRIIRIATKSEEIKR
jgi:hypothetical protein